MKPSKIDELTRCYAGAGYDVSASRSESTSQAANQNAATTINFGSGDVSQMGGPQTAAPTAQAVAARNAGDSSIPGVSLPGQSWHENIDWPMVAVAVVAVAAIAGAIYYSQKGAKAA